MVVGQGLMGGERCHFGECTRHSFPLVPEQTFNAKLLFASNQKFSETAITICPSTSNAVSLKMHGRLSDGSYYKVDDLMDSTVEDNLVIGKPLGLKETEFRDKLSGDSMRGVFWVKGKIGPHYLVSHGKGFGVWNNLVDVTKFK